MWLYYNSKMRDIFRNGFLQKLWLHVKADELKVSLLVSKTSKQAGNGSSHPAQGSKRAKSCSKYTKRHYCENFVEIPQNTRETRKPLFSRLETLGFLLIAHDEVNVHCSPAK